jgi:hypothetical protein
LIAELLNFGAFLGFMGVNAAAIRQFYFLPQTGRTRSFFLDLVVRSLASIICLVIWLGLGRVAKIVGAVWFAVGLSYLALRTRGFRLAPLMIDFNRIVYAREVWDGHVPSSGTRRPTHSASAGKLRGVTQRALDERGGINRPGLVQSASSA